MRHLLRRIAYILRPGRLDSDLAEELEFHREMKQRELEQRGLDADEAAFAAQRAVGNTLLARDRARDVWIWPWLDSLSQDVRFALKLARRERGFTLVAALALGLGIGVTNTFFIVVNAVCIRGLPIDAPHRVMYLSALDTSGREQGMSYRDFEDIRGGTQAFEGLSAFASVPTVVGDEGIAPDRVMGTYISANAFDLLRQQPLLGRTFRPEDDREGAARTVVLAYGVWSSRYGSDRSIVGRTIRVNGAPSVVIGIMAEGFKFPINSELWQPIATMPGIGEQRRDLRTLGVFGRLTDGTAMPQGVADVQAIAERLAREYPETNRGIHPRIVRINDRYNGKITDRVWIAFITAGIFVLLVACANVSNLLLMRAVHRSHEIAIRASLGATRCRVVRQLLVESLILAILGGIVGLGFSLAGARLLSVTLTENAPYWLRYTMDVPGFAALAAVCLGTVLLVGLSPALHIARTNINDVLQEGGRRTHGGVRARRLTTLFVVAEFALTLFLVTASGIGYRNFTNLQRSEIVINPSQLLTMWITLPVQKYAAAEQRMAFHQRFEDRLRGIGAIASAAFATALPFDGAPTRPLAIEGRPEPDVAPTVSMVAIEGRYFDTLGVSLLRGRDLTESDGTPGYENVIVNDRLAAMFFPDTEPLGKRIRFVDRGPSQPARWLTIVGVSPSVRQRPQGPEPDPVVYLPFRAAPPPNVAVLVRNTSDPGALASIMRDELRGLDTDLPVYRVRTMEQVISESRLQGRVSQLIVTVIACIALALAAVGLYAVTAHAVAQRTHELGVLMALGATPRQVTMVVFRRATKQLVVGILAGLLCTSILGPLFGGANGAREMTDMLAQVSAVVLVVVIALGACIWPARRAARLDPMTALRQE